MKKRTILVVIIVLLLLGAAVLFFRKAPSGKPSAEPEASAVEQESPAPIVIEGEGED